MKKDEKEKNEIKKTNFFLRSSNDHNSSDAYWTFKKHLKNIYQ